MKQDFYLETLMNHYSQRKAVNVSYSMNAYARDLQIRPSQLSEVLRKKKGLSEDSARKIANRLKLKAVERENFIQSVSALYSRSPLIRKSAIEKLEKNKNEIELSATEFETIKDWIHFGLMEYLRVHQKRNIQIKTAAKYFKVTSQRIENALKNLLALGIVKETNGQYHVDEQYVFAPKNVRASAKRLHHLKLLKVSMGSYLTQDFDERDYFSQIMAIDTNRIPEAKKLIRQFHKDMNELLSPENRTKNSVYCFSTQMFSLKDGGRLE